MPGDARDQARTGRIVACVIAVGALVTLGWLLPWAPPSSALPTVSAENHTVSMNYQWVRFPDRNTSLDLPSLSVTTFLSAPGSAVSSHLTLTEEGGAEGDPNGYLGGFSVSISGSLVPTLGATSVRFVLMEWENSTLRPTLLILPDGPGVNLSNVAGAWVNQGFTTQSGGPGGVALQVALANESAPSLDPGTASYRFTLSLFAETMYSGGLGQITFSLFAILEGFNDLVYAGITVHIATVLE